MQNPLKSFLKSLITVTFVIDTCIYYILMTFLMNLVKHIESKLHCIYSNKLVIY